MAVKKAVQCGNVEDAIEKVNDLNPEVRDALLCCYNLCEGDSWVNYSHIIIPIIVC